MAEDDPKKTRFSWVDLAKAVAMPLVTLVVGYWFNSSLNSRQEHDNKVRLYADMMGRREEADSGLRKDMFKSILDTFLKPPPPGQPLTLEGEVLNIELLAYNFHESLDLGPLFKHVRRELDVGNVDQSFRWRLERVAQDVTGRQLAVLADSGMVETGDLGLGPWPTPEEDKEHEGAAAWTMGKSMIQLSPGARVRGPTLCMSVKTDDEDAEVMNGLRVHFRQFNLEYLDYVPDRREVQFSLTVSQPMKKADCQKLLDSSERNVDAKATFWAGLFAFPMIDNTHLTHSERCAVTVNSIDDGEDRPDGKGKIRARASISVAYFPASRASLKDKPYYDEVLHDLLNNPGSSKAKEH